MRRFAATLAGLAAFAALAAASAFGAGGGKGAQTLTATCTTSGGVTIHASRGRSAWVDGTHWVVLRFTGTFTPAGGQPRTFTKVYGRKQGLLRRTVQSCTGAQTDAAGNTFAFTATVAKTTR